MPEFVMDREGEVCNLTFDQLAAFTQGYIEAMLFTETCPGISMVDWADPENQEAVEQGQADGSIPGDAGFGDLSPETFEGIQSDCIAFEHQAHALLIEAHQLGYDRSQAGRDFWFTRNGHGVGFWDRDVLKGGLGEKLTEIAKGFGEVSATFNPDEASPTGYGFIYLD